MKRLFIYLISIMLCSPLFADFPKEKILVIIKEEEIHLGDDFCKIIDILGNTSFILHSSNYIILRKYEYDNLIIYTSNPESDECTKLIYGIYFSSKTYSLINKITIGSSKIDVIITFGKPDDIYKNSFYYYNEEFDILELKITFESEDNICSIQLFMGT